MQNDSLQPFYAWCRHRGACIEGLGFIEDCANWDTFWNTAPVEFLIWVFGELGRRGHRAWACDALRALFVDEDGQWHESICKALEEGRVRTHPRNLQADLNPNLCGALCNMTGPNAVRIYHGLMSVLDVRSSATLHQRFHQRIRKFSMEEVVNA